MPKSSKQQMTKLQRQELVKKWKSEDGLALLAYYARQGLSFSMIEQRAGLPKGFVGKLAKSSKKVARALNEGRELTIAKVEGKLIQKALGYKKKKMVVGVDKFTGKVYKEEVEEEVEPNFSAIAMYLNNHAPEIYKRGDLYVRQETIRAEQELKESMISDKLPTEIQIVSVPANFTVERGEEEVVDVDYEVKED